MQTSPERFLTTEEILADYSLPDGEYFIPNLSKVRDMATSLVLDIIPMMTMMKPS